MKITQSIQDTLYLIKNTFAIIAKNPEALRPTITQITLAAIFYFIFLAGIAILFISKSGSVILLAMISIILSILFFLLFPFIKMYYKAAQSWIVYHTFTGNNILYKEGLSRARKNKGDIFILAFLDIIFNALANKLKQGTGRGGFLGSILNIILWWLGKAVEEGWDLAGHYLLPASIIQEKNVGETLPELKNLKTNVPASLAGVFGIDFVGDVIKGYIIYFGIFFALIGLGLYFVINSFIPLVIIILVLIGVNLFMKILVEMVKTVYFTLFYVSITMPVDIVPEYREEVTHYITHQTAGEVSNQKKSQETTEQKVEKLIPYIHRYREQKYSDEEIISFLTKSGWPEDAIKIALEQA